MTRYSQYVSKRATLQSMSASMKQRKNHAGGFTFVVDDWARLDRFLTLGVDGPTYYTSERALTVDNAACVERCLSKDGLRVVRQVIEVSQSGRAPKNDPAIFVLAMAAATSDLVVRRAALDAVPAVCRTSAHLFAFADIRSPVPRLGACAPQRDRRLVQRQGWR